MQTICYTATLRVRRPEDKGNKVVDFNAYRRQTEVQKVPAPTLEQRPLRRPSLRRRLVLTSLILEVALSASVLLLALTATVRFLFL